MIKKLHLILFLLILYWLLAYKLYYFTHSQINPWIEFYTILTAGFLLSRFIIAYYYDDDHDRKFSSKKYPTISFVIPCKNEEDSIAKTIEVALSSDYPARMECIAVDDGSTGNTLEEMKRIQKKIGKSKLKIISFSKNLGKRDAMSEGVLKASGEIIIFVDSDSFVGPDAAKKIVYHFLEDDKVLAVSGNTMVENVKTNVLTRMQAARYGVSFDIFKACESVFGTVTCCPGCFSAYRRQAILDVMDKWRYHQFLGTRSTFGDDRSLTNFILKQGKVVYCRRTIATTIVPEKFKKFIKQQMRWKKSWIGEGAHAASFFYKKHPVPALSFYINLVIPIFGPLILVKVLVFDTLLHGATPIFFINGVIVMSILFGLYYYLIAPNKYWMYVTVFTLLYTFVLVWQMPYAIYKVRDTGWGTR